MISRKNPFRPQSHVDLAASKSRSEPVSKPVRRATSADHSPVRQLTGEEEGQLLQSFDGVVLTAFGQPIAIHTEKYHLVALLDDGRFLQNRRASLEEIIPYTEMRAARAGYAINSRYTASGDFLRKLYERFHKRDSDDTEVVSDEQSKTAGSALFHSIVESASKDRASDIHIEVQSFGTVVQFRIDGRLERQDLFTVSHQKGMRLLNSAYSSHDEGDGSVLELHNFPKGQISGSIFALPAGVQSLRLQFLPLPTTGGALVVRLLYIESVGSYADVDRLGYAPFQLTLIHRARRRLSGLNLISGITGSGKSTTLEQTLSAIIRDTKGARAVVTIEDPPEYVIPGAKQVPVTGSVEAREMGFAQAMRAVLRADPDIVMIGEVRDDVSANLALRAAKTGHQVWSTVHAISAVQALDRFVEEGVDEKRLFHPDVLSCLIAQRLVPMLCPHCSVGFNDLGELGAEDELPPETRFARHLVKTIFRDEPHLMSLIRFRSLFGQYCTDPSVECRDGYQGRTLIAEVVLCNWDFVSVCRREGTIEADDFWISKMDGVRMIEHGVMKLLQGLFDPNDLNDAGDLESFDPDRIPFLISKGSKHGFFADVLDRHGELVTEEEIVDVETLMGE